MTKSTHYDEMHTDAASSQSEDTLDLAEDPSHAGSDDEIVAEHDDDSAAADREMTDYMNNACLTTGGVAKSGMPNKEVLQVLIDRGFLIENVHDNGVTYITLAPQLYNETLAAASTLTELLRRLEIDRFDPHSWERVQKLVAHGDRAIQLIRERRSKSFGALPMLLERLGDAIYFGAYDVKRARGYYMDAQQRLYCQTMVALTSNISVDVFQQLLVKSGVDSQISTLVTLLQRDNDEKVSAVANFFLGCFLLSPTCTIMSTFKDSLDADSKEFIDEKKELFLAPDLLGHDDLVYSMMNDVFASLQYDKKRLNLQIWMRPQDTKGVLLSLYGLSISEHCSGNYGKALSYLELTLAVVQQMYNENPEATTVKVNDVEHMMATATQNEMRNTCLHLDSVRAYL